MLEAILFLFNTTGLIFGPLILLSGGFSLFLCFKATRTPNDIKLRRQSLLISFLPFFISLFGAMVGYLILINHGGNRSIQVANWLALGKCCLAGLVVSLFPFSWSIFLNYRRGIISWSPICFLFFKQFFRLKTSGKPIRLGIPYKGSIS